MKKILLLLALISSYSFSAQKSGWAFCCLDQFSGKPIYVDTLNIVSIFVDDDSAAASVWISNSNDVVPNQAAYQLLEFKMIKNTNVIKMRSMRVSRLNGGSVEEHSGKQIWHEIIIQSTSGKIFEFVVKNLASKEN